MVTRTMSPIGPPIAASAEPSMAMGKLGAKAIKRKPAPSTILPLKSMVTLRRITRFPITRLLRTLPTPYAPTMRPYAPMLSFRTRAANSGTPTVKPAPQERLMIIIETSAQARGRCARTSCIAPLISAVMPLIPLANSCSRTGFQAKRRPKENTAKAEMKKLAASSVKKWKSGIQTISILIVWMPLFHFFTLDAASFFISAFAVFSLGRRFAWKPVREQEFASGIKGITAEIRGAMQLVRAHRPLAWALVSMIIISLSWGAGFTVGVPLLAARVLKDNIGAYGLIVGAYGVGNVLSNLVIGNLFIRRKVTMLFSGKIVLGAGFLLIAFAPNLPIAMLGSALAAIGGPMGDIVLVTMIQNDLPSEQIGKVYSLLMLVENTGTSLGLLLAVPLFVVLSIRSGIALCALLMITVGTAGLIRFRAQESKAVAA